MIYYTTNGLISESVWQLRCEVADTPMPELFLFLALSPAGLEPGAWSRSGHLGSVLMPTLTKSLMALSYPRKKRVRVSKQNVSSCFTVLCCIIVHFKVISVSQIITVRGKEKEKKTPQTWPPAINLDTRDAPKYNSFFYFMCIWLNIGTKQY